MKEIIDASGGGGGGGTGGVLVVGIDMQTMTLDKTWQEINEPKFAVLPFSVESETFIYLLSDIKIVGSYLVYFTSISSDAPFPSIIASTNTADGYPVILMD